MTELERRALLGDQKAQKECTEKGIVLPCPCCSGKALKGKDCDDEGYYWWPVIYCESCFLEVSGDKVIGSKNAVVTDELRGRWNTRSAPPFGRCRDCKHYRKNNRLCVRAAPHKFFRTYASRYCSSFISKEADHE